MLPRLKELFQRSRSFDQKVRSLTSQDLILNRDLARSIYQPGGSGYKRPGAPGDTPQHLYTASIIS
jgi:hypothetical protein